MRLHISIEDVINVWVRRWASDRGCKAYPALQSFMRESPNKVTRYTITELDEHSYLKIDEAVIALHDLNLEAYQVLMAAFLQRQDRKEICQTVGISLKTYHERINVAKSFMEGAVFGSGLIKLKL